MDQALQTYRAVSSTGEYLEVQLLKTVGLGSAVPTRAPIAPSSAARQARPAAVQSGAR